MTNPVQRNFPRLSFAGRPAPRLETPLESYEILDLSPGGLRFRVPEGDGTRVTIGDLLRATIHFPADRSVEVEGRVLRLGPNEAAVLLEQGHERLAAPLPAGPATAKRAGLAW